MICKWISEEDNGVVCEREAGDLGYCLFHKYNKTKQEKILFIKAIKEKKISDFRGFVFEDDFNINEIIKYQYDKLSFNEAAFLKNVNFEEYEFKKDVSFNGTEFKKNVTFKNSSFLENCDFYNTKFNKDYVDKKIFEKVKFKGQNLVIDNIENLPRMDGIIFSGCSKFILRDTDYKKEDYLYGKINYRIARNQASKIGDYEKIGFYYYKERAYGSHIMKSSDYPTHREYLCAKFFDRLSKYAIGYGERPWNIFFITILTISLFAFMYMFVGIRTTDYKIIGLSVSDMKSYSLIEIINMYIDLWYFSMITFSTVGYGDMIAVSILGKILVTIEVFFGVTIGATWASVVIKRMIR